MSQAWRTRKGIKVTSGGFSEPIPQLDDSNVYEGYVAYDPSTSDPDTTGSTITKPMSTDDLLIGASPQFPGNREEFHPGTVGLYTLQALGYGGQGNVRDNVDWEIEGQSGIVNDALYSTGDVGRDIVDVHAMGGEQAVIRRMRNPSEAGAVATSDYNALLAISVAQATAGYFPNEASQVDLVKVV